MSDALIHPEQEGAKPSGGRWRWLFYALALVLLGVCIYLAFQAAEAEEGPSGWERLRQASWQDLALMLSLVVGSVAINGWMFWIILKPFEPEPDEHRPVTCREMISLIAASSLLNYLPMRAGMIGRAAYLKKLHGIDYRLSVVMLAIVAATTLYVFALTAGVTLWRQELDVLWWMMVGVGVLLAAVVAVPVMRWKLRLLPGVPVDWFDRHRRSAWTLVALLMAGRAVDVLMLGGRLYIAADIFGTPISFAAAVVMATGGMLITLATPLPNGLGLREGLYGLFAAVGIAGAAMPDGPKGVALGLIDRAAEAIVFIVLGLLAMWYLHRKQQNVPAEQAPAEAADDPRQA